MTYELNKEETGNKAGKFHYTVTDENGNVISERKSNNNYVACTIDGKYYFGRLDLIGKGDHGKYLKRCAGWGWHPTKDKFMPNVHNNILEPSPIAYSTLKFN